MGKSTACDETWIDVEDATGFRLDHGQFIERTFKGIGMLHQRLLKGLTGITDRAARQLRIDPPQGFGRIDRARNPIDDPNG